MIGEQILKVKKDGLVTQEIKMTPNPNYPQKIEVKRSTNKQFRAFKDFEDLSITRDEINLTDFFCYGHTKAFQEGYQMRMRDWLRSPSHSIGTK